MNLLRGAGTVPPRAIMRSALALPAIIFCFNLFCSTARYLSLVSLRSAEGLPNPVSGSKAKIMSRRRSVFFGKIVIRLAWITRPCAAFPELAKMARDTLAIPASGCSVERLFSVSERIATWQRNRLRDRTISDWRLDDIQSGNEFEGSADVIGRGRRTSCARDAWEDS